MKKARLIFLASLVIMAVAAFKGNPQAEDNVPKIAQPAPVHAGDSATSY